MTSSDAAHANCASADAGAAHNTQAGYIYCMQGPLIQDISAWLKSTNLCANMQIYTDIAKMALNGSSQLTVLHYPKCKAMRIDTPNGVAKIKH